jgi:hypothetical protein
MRYIDAATWVRTWLAAGPRLEEIRRRELRQAGVEEFVRSMADAFEASVGVARVTTSGLVEQQRLFARLRR